MIVLRFMNMDGKVYRSDVSRLVGAEWYWDLSQELRDRIVKFFEVRLEKVVESEG